MDVFVHYQTPPDIGFTNIHAPTHVPSPSSSSSPSHKQRLNTNAAAATPETRWIQDTDEHKVTRARKGHTKSRNGCFTCKRMRLKCKENHPICDYCAHRDLKCEWPKPSTGKIKKQERVVTAIVQKATKDPAATIPAPYSFQSDSPSFTIQDFRLFNHFIQNAYPRHPVDNDAVWKHEIPCLASDYEYLLHSMLALSASEISQTEECPHKMRELAFSHRVKAITALNAAIQRGVNSAEEGNAMLATCFSLLFQSTVISDGLVEYMTFIRGTKVVATQMYKSNLRVFFEHMREDDRPQSLPPGTEDAPMILPELVTGARNSLERFYHLCKVRLEREIHALLVHIVDTLVISSNDAYFKLRRVYRNFACTMSHSDFRYFCDPENAVCRLLQAHFVALQLIMEPINKRKPVSDMKKCPMKEQSRVATAGWLRSLHRDIGTEWVKWYAWTMWVEREVGGGRILDGTGGVERCEFVDAENIV